MQLPNFLRKHTEHILSNTDLITKSDNPMLSEALKSARTNLMYSLANTEGGKSVVVTSCLAAEGKTTTCINLAVSLAQTEARVLLIDADLRRPRMHTYLDKKNKAGLANYLGGFCELDAIIHCADDLNLDYITAGDLPPNPAELLSSQKIKTLVDAVKERYDYVLFDTPPINLVTDATALIQLTEHAILVCKCGTTITTEIKKALSKLEFANAKILGFITIDQRSNTKKAKDYSEYYKHRES